MVVLHLVHLSTSKKEEKQETIKISQKCTKTENSNTRLSNVQITENNELLQTVDLKKKSKNNPLKKLNPQTLTCDLFPFTYNSN